MLTASTFDLWNLGLALVAVAISAFAFYRDKFYFRGASVTLANQFDRQHSMISAFGKMPPSVQELFPQYPDEMITALVRVVWLNTGDRATRWCRSGAGLGSSLRFEDARCRVRGQAFETSESRLRFWS